MTQIEAREWLAVITDASKLPTLSESELDMLVRMASRPDSDGLPPGDADYSLTVDFNYAAVQGWQIKAGRCAPMHDATTQGRTFSASQVHDHCIKQVAEYRRRLMTTVSLSGCRSPFL